MTLSKFSEYEIIKMKNDVVITTYRQIPLKNTSQGKSLVLLETIYININNKYKSEKIPKADSAPRNRYENGASCQNC